MGKSVVARLGKHMFMVVVALVVVFYIFPSCCLLWLSGGNPTT